MSLTDPFLLLPVFSAAECEKIIAYGNLQVDPGWWTGNDDARVRQATSRTIAHSVEIGWVHQRLHQVCSDFNARHFGFTVQRLDPDLLFARYDAGDHFDWHIDLGDGAAEHRKVSIAVLLSEPSDFEGGDWDFEPERVQLHAPQRGCAVIFPAYLQHRVTPITSGTRYSLVAWLTGPRFV